MSFNKDSVRTVIFEAHTPSGKAFDVGLIICILLSVLAVLLDTVSAIHEPWGDELYLVEWFFTILFTIEYGLRLEQAIGQVLRNTDDAREGPRAFAEKRKPNFTGR